MKRIDWVRNITRLQEGDHGQGPVREVQNCKTYEALWRVPRPSKGHSHELSRSEEAQAQVLPY